MEKEYESIRISSCIFYKQEITGKKTVRKAKTTTSYKIKGLKKGKKYYVKVRSYKTVNGKRIYGAYSTAQKQQSNRDDKELVS